METSYYVCSHGSMPSCTWNSVVSHWGTRSWAWLWKLHCAPTFKISRSGHGSCLTMLCKPPCFLIHWKIEVLVGCKRCPALEEKLQHLLLTRLYQTANSLPTRFTFRLVEGFRGLWPRNKSRRIWLLSTAWKIWFDRNDQIFNRKMSASSKTRWNQWLGRNFNAWFWLYALGIHSSDIHGRAHVQIRWCAPESRWIEVKVNFDGAWDLDVEGGGAEFTIRNGRGHLLILAAVALRCLLGESEISSHQQQTTALAIGRSACQLTGSMHSIYGCIRDIGVNPTDRPDNYRHWPTPRQRLGILWSWSRSTR